MIPRARDAGAGDSPGLVLLARDASVVGMNVAAEQWLDELGRVSGSSHLPIEVYAVAAKLREPAVTEATTPRLRVRTRVGRWALLHASWMSGTNGATTTVIIEEAAPAEVAPLLMAAYGITDRERTVVGLACRGLSTREIAARLNVTTNTVQDHSKSIFEKTGVRSRRELVATILRRAHSPRTTVGS